MKRFIWILLFTLTLSACNEGQSLAAEGTEMTAKTNVKINLGQPINDLLDDSPHPFEEDCLAHVGLCWYEIKKRFAEADLPSVTVFQNDTLLLALDDVGRVSAVVDETQGRFVEQVTLSVRGLPDNSLHSEQKGFVYQLLNTLLGSGWTHFYRFPAARISGAEAHKIVVPDEVMGMRVIAHPWFDPRYEASLEQWLSAGSTYHWFFYQSGIYLHVSVQRSNSRDAPAERGTYLINMELQTELAYWPQHFSEEDQSDWRKLMPALLEQYAQQRAKLEREAEAAGIKIEDSYRDPAIKLLGD
ncbi:MAG: hypothetical protein KBT85_15975 [Pseudomonas sp.]|nr:hypothetical protein [Pseudomonas sp.]